MATSFVPISIPMDSCDLSVDLLLDEVADAIDRCRELDETSDLEICNLTVTQTSDVSQELVHGSSQMIQDDTSCGIVSDVESITAMETSRYETDHENRIPNSIPMEKCDSNTGCSLFDQDSDSDQFTEALDESFEWEIYSLFMPPHEQDAQLDYPAVCVSPTRSMTTSETDMMAGEQKANPKKRKVLSAEAEESRR
jgi:hypothetical protein